MRRSPRPMRRWRPSRAMQSGNCDVYALGSALLDLEYQVDEGFLRKHGLAKGRMALTEEAHLDALLADLADAQPQRTSGGSAANTAAAVQGFGGQAYFSCKVADDPVGRWFLQDLADFGIRTKAGAWGAGKSGRCLVLVTADAERTLNTCLGVANQLSAEDLDEAALAKARFFYVEGYLSVSPEALETACQGRRLAEASGVATAVSMSDPSVVERFRDSLAQLLGNGVDCLFCNEQEALAWAGSDRLDIAVAELKDIARTCNITLGARGSLSVLNGRCTEIPGFPAEARDTNGAGDIYAGACLHAWSQGMQPALAARFGNFAAAALVQRYGARLKRKEDYRQVRADFQRMASGQSSPAAR